MATFDTFIFILLKYIDGFNYEKLYILD